MRIGYARVSKSEPESALNLARQELLTGGCDKAFVEHLPSNARGRPYLEAAIEFCRDGDEFVVARLDRLARSITNLLEIERTLANKGVALRVLGTPIETATPSGRLIFQALTSVAEFERAVANERQREAESRQTILTAVAS
jgi:DNA invertase Pin-like site-specific DNA recombinase